MLLFGCGGGGGGGGSSSSERGTTNVMYYGNSVGASFFVMDLSPGMACACTLLVQCKMHSLHCIGHAQDRKESGSLRQQEKNWFFFIPFRVLCY